MQISDISGGKRPSPSVQLGLMLMALLWGLVFVAIKLGGQAMPIEVYNANRFVMGVTLLAIVTWRRGRWPRVDWRTALELTALGLVGHGLMQMAFVTGIMRTASATAALIYGCTPLVVAVLSSAFGLERLNGRQWMGLGLAAMGMAAVVLSRDGPSPLPTAVGNALVGAATLLMALYTIWSRRLLARLDLVYVTTWALGVGALVMVLWSWPKQSLALYRTLSWRGWGLVLYGAILALVVPNLLFLWGVREIGRSRTAVFVNAVPLLGCLAGWMLLGERFRSVQIIVAVGIVAGIYLTQSKPQNLTGAKEMTHV